MRPGRRDRSAAFLAGKGPESSVTYYVTLPPEKRGLGAKSEPGEKRAGRKTIRAKNEPGGNQPREARARRASMASTSVLRTER